MSRSFYVNSDIDPRELAINLRFKGKQILHPRVRAAQNALILEIKQAIQEERDYTPCERCGVNMVFSNPTRRSDVDGPIKRTLDSIEKAHKALGYQWHDGKIDKVIASRSLGFTGMIVTMVDLDEED